MSESKLSQQQLENIRDRLGAEIYSNHYLVSGAANHIFRITTSRGDSIIAKLSKVDQPALFKYEADALNHMARTQTVHVPKIIHFSSEYLLMEDLGAEFKGVDGEAWRVFGAQFGSMHRVQNESFGYPDDNYLGIWPQKNTPTKNWIEFYYQNRLCCYLDSGKNPNILTSEDRDGISKIVEKLRDLIPDQKPSLCHGDFWINNLIRKADGKIYVIDPAIHFGLPEADLAMTQMYETFPESFYEGYREAHPLLPDWKERLPLYQLNELILMIAQFGDLKSIETLRSCVKRFQ